MCDCNSPSNVPVVKLKLTKTHNTPLRLPSVKLRNMVPDEIAIPAGILFRTARKYYEFSEPLANWLVKNLPDHFSVAD